MRLGRTIAPADRSFESLYRLAVEFFGGRTPCHSVFSLARFSFYSLILLGNEISDKASEKGVDPSHSASDIFG